MPIHFTQKNSVAELPNTTNTTSKGLESTSAFSTAHLLTSIPKGARNMPAIPIWIMIESFGIATIRPDMLSMSRLFVFCSKVPTHRKSRAFVTAWKRIRRIPAQSAS